MNEVGRHLSAQGAPVTYIRISIHVLDYLTTVPADAQMTAGQAYCVSLLLIANDAAARLLSFSTLRCRFAHSCRVI